MCTFVNGFVRKTAAESDLVRLLRTNETRDRVEIAMVRRNECIESFSLCIPDQYGRGGRSRYDDGRRSPRRRYSPDTRYRRDSNLPNPMDQDKLVPYRSFLEWYRDAAPDRFFEDEAVTRDNPSDRKVGLKARYDEFRADFQGKQV